MKVAVMLLFGCVAIPFVRLVSAEPARPPIAPEPERETISVPMTFDPGGGPWKGETPFRGASWSKLSPGFEPNMLLMQVRAGLGDRFPVETKDNTKLFDVILLNGTNDQLELAIQSEEEEQKVKVMRAKASGFTVAGIKYEALFPRVNVSVERGEKPTSNKAMIIIKQRK